MSNTSASAGYLIPSGVPAEDDALVDIITAAIVGITGLDGTLVRPKWQTKSPQQPTISVNWCAVGITQDDAEPGDPYIEHDPNGAAGLGQDTLSRTEKFRALVSFYGPNAGGYAKLLRDGLGVPQNLETLQQNAINFISAGTIQTVPESINLEWCMRKDLQVTFARRKTLTYAVETIASANIELHADDVITNIVP